MVYSSYNENSSLFPNQAVQGRDSKLYVKEDVPELPRRYHKKLRKGNEKINFKRIYPKAKFPELYEDEDEEGGAGTPDPTPTEDPAGPTPTPVTPDEGGETA